MSLAIAIVVFGGFTADALARVVDNLQNRLAYTTDVGASGSEIAYGLYVLARNGVAPIGDLRYLADTKLSSLATPIAKSQLAAALALPTPLRHANRPRAAYYFFSFIGTVHR